jgi:hypothetical protein
MLSAMFQYSACFSTSKPAVEPHYQFRRPLRNSTAPMSQGFLRLLPS